VTDGYRSPAYDLKEYAERLRLGGDRRTAAFGGEILDLLLTADDAKHVLEKRAVYEDAWETLGEIDDVLAQASNELHAISFPEWLPTGTVACVRFLCDAYVEQVSANTPVRVSG
jgi:hypothetical protein